MFEAIKNSDLDLFDRILTDNYISISGARGVVMTKDERLKVLKETFAQGIQVESITIDKYKVYVYNNSAILSCFGTQKIKIQGINRVGKFLSTVVFVQLNNKEWKIAAAHVSEVY